MMFEQLLEKPYHLIRLAKNRRCATHHGECAGNGKRIISNTWAATNRLNNASMPNDSSEGTFLLIHPALGAIILFPLT